MVEMHDQSDAQLLRAYAEHGAEAAFAEIVARHTDLVYSAALRQVYSPDLARDVTQSVFTDLARKAREVSFKLSPEASLVGWLYRGTHFAARDLYRNEARRTQRERQAMEQLHPAPETPPDWEQLRPVLDEAMSELDDPDRDAVLLRFFKNHDLRTVGATLGISDDAAQKRVSRAVERLREFFAKRGVTVGTSGLAVVISANAVQAAPVGFAVAISTAAALTGTTLATTATITATKAIAMTALQKTIVTATIAVLAGAGIYEARQASQLRDQVQTLQQQQAEQNQGLQSERNEAANRLSALVDEIERAKGKSTELLKLRSEVARLQNEAKELARTVAASAQNKNDAMESAAKELLAKANLLKQRIEHFPDKKIPEIQFLTQTDWLKLALQDEPTIDRNTQNILYRVRIASKERFAAMMAQALNAYTKSNNGKLPISLAELKSYFESPVEDTVLERYQLVRTGNLNQGLPGEMLVAEKAVVDNVQDTLYSVGLDSYSFKNSLGTNLFNGSVMPIRGLTSGKFE
jgi:RNA polymerase sigma factor (sigma-70 family)